MIYNFKRVTTLLLVLFRPGEPNSRFSPFCLQRSRLARSLNLHPVLNLCSVKLTTMSYSTGFGGQKWNNLLPDCWDLSWKRRERVDEDARTFSSPLYLLIRGKYSIVSSDASDDWAWLFQQLSIRHC